VGLNFERFYMSYSTCDVDCIEHEWSLDKCVRVAVQFSDLLIKWLWKAPVCIAQVTVTSIPIQRDNKISL
jgi:hypothetical protein